MLVYTQLRYTKYNMNLFELPLDTTLFKKFFIFILADVFSVYTGTSLLAVQWNTQVT